MRRDNCAAGKGCAGLDRSAEQRCGANPRATLPAGPMLQRAWKQCTGKTYQLLVAWLPCYLSRARQSANTYAHTARFCISLRSSGHGGTAAALHVSHRIALVRHLLELLPAMRTTGFCMLLQCSGAGSSACKYTDGSWGALQVLRAAAGGAQLLGSCPGCPAQGPVFPTGTCSRFD